MGEVNFDDFFEPEEDNCEDFDFIDPSILQQFQRMDISIEKIQKDLFNFDEKDDDEIYGEKATRKFEFQIQVNRILQIFDEMIEKIETLLCIQIFVKDRSLLEKYFTSEDIDSLEKYCGQRVMFDADSCDEMEKEKVNRLIRLLLNSNLNHHVESHKENISLQKKMLSSSIKELRNIIDLRLQLTAPKELKKEQILHQMWKKYEKTKEKIASLREKWIYRKQNFDDKMRDKYASIESFRKEIEVHRTRNEVEIQNQIKDSNVKIVEFCQQKDESIEHKLLVTSEAEDMYKSFLNENLTKEAKLRERKDKAISSLQAILQKFDIEVGDERTNELKELFDTLNLQKEEFACWQTTVCEPQIKLHEKLMFEKEEAERLEIESAMFVFMMNRSAKILQKYWRNMVAKRKKKKGKRGGKKK